MKLPWNRKPLPQDDGYWQELKHECDDPRCLELDCESKIDVSPTGDELGSHDNPIRVDIERTSILGEGL